MLLGWVCSLAAREGAVSVRIGMFWKENSRKKKRLKLEDFLHMMPRFINWPPLKKWIKDVSHMVISFHLLRNIKKTSFSGSFDSLRAGAKVEELCSSILKACTIQVQINARPPTGQPILNANKTEQK